MMDLTQPPVLPGPQGIQHALVSTELAAEAVRLVLPTLEAALFNPHIGESGALAIVIMNPAMGPASSAFDEAILLEYAVGDSRRWDADYLAFARAKARISWRTGLDSHVVQSLRPHLLQAGDPLLWGGVAFDGIVVAASGAHPHFDEAFAGMVAISLRALAKDAWLKNR